MIVPCQGALRSAILQVRNPMIKITPARGSSADADRVSLKAEF
jgi:hypothetical protein